VGVRGFLLALAILPLGSRPLAARPAGATRAAPAGRVARSTVEARLRAYEPGPASGWQALGAGADEALIEIGRDPKVDVLIRARAVSALGYFPTLPARHFLEQTIASGAGDKLLLRRACVALGWMGGLGVPARLAPLLEHADPDVRIDAAVGLALTRLGTAADILRKRVDTEREPRVRAQMGRQLRVLEDALAAAR
jgi:HEAT repeat protein